MQHDSIEIHSIQDVSKKKTCFLFRGTCLVLVTNKAYQNAPILENVYAYRRMKDENVHADYDFSKEINHII